MAIDRFAQCPGGTGKKIKFCCPDLTAELDKIQHMLEGEQRHACLDYIEQLDRKYPERACVETVKALLLADLGRMDEARATLDALLARQPNNPVALAELATVRAAQGEPRESIDSLQQALENCDQWIPARVVQAVGQVGMMLMAAGDVLSARGHLLLSLAMNREDQQALQVLGQLHASPQVPVLLKDQPSLGTCPADAPYRAELEAAMEPANRGQWRRSAQSLESLAAKVSDAPVVWRNLATLRAWLGDWPGSAEALRKLASLDVPLDDAVLAEAAAQMLAPPPAGDTVDLVHITWTVNDFEQVLAKLNASSQTVSLEAPPAVEGDDQPPPRAAWYLLDRPMPASAAGLSRNDIPHIVTDLLLFGRETDREARLEGQTYLHDLERADQALREICGEALGAAGEPETIRQVSRSQTVLSWRWQLPEDATPDQVQQLVSEQRAEAIGNVWPATPAAVLDGQTPEQAAADPQRRVPLLAAILRLELSLDDPSITPLIDALRTRLGLPLPAPVEAASVDINALPLARLSRLDAAKTSDDDLLELQNRAMHFGARTAAWQLTQEILNRPSLAERASQADCYGTLAALCDNGAEAVDYLQRARDAAQAAGQSCGPWDVEQMAMRLERGEVDEFQELLVHVQQKHTREQNVVQALFALLQRTGLVGRDGRPRTMAAAPEEAAGLILPDSGGGEKGGIWTPGGEAAAKEKPGIWTPGMD